MSIKHFSNRPCPECKKDTMHFIAKCTECGVAQPDAYEARGKSIRRHFAMMKSGRGADYIARKKLDQEIQKRENSAIPMLATASQTTEATFGTGRTRTKV